jgi:hypothetical protein
VTRQEGDQHIQTVMAACLCSQMVIININHFARVQSHGASLALLRRLHEVRRRYRGPAGFLLGRTKIVYAIRDWSFEDDQAKMSELKEELLSGFKAQWFASECKATDEVSLNVRILIKPAQSQLAKSHGLRQHPANPMKWEEAYEISFLFLPNCAPDAKLVFDKDYPAREQAMKEWLEHKQEAFKQAAQSQLHRVMVGFGMVAIAELSTIFMI